MWKKFAWVSLLTFFVIPLYTTFVLSVMWGWFIVPPFHVEQISFWGMYGLVLIVSMFGREETFKEDQRWKILMPAVQMCVPEARKPLLEEMLKEHEAESWNEIGWELVDRLLR